MRPEILTAATRISTTRSQIHLSRENAGATPRSRAVGAALEELEAVGPCMSWNLLQIPLVPEENFLMMASTAVPPLVDWDCAERNFPALLNLLDSALLTKSLDLVQSMDLLATCMNKNTNQ